MWEVSPFCVFAIVKKLVKQAAMLWDIVAVMSGGLQVNRFQTSAGSLVADV